MTQHPQEVSTFRGLGIAPGILELLDRLKYVTPTPIQQQAIPVAVEGKDVLGIAQTGTGKTLAFGVPLIQRLSQAGNGRALVLVPTRELALQVDDTLRKLGQPFNLRSVILIGGMNMSTQVQVVRKPSTRVLIATPGRLLDHIEQRTVTLTDMRVVVLDEADRMLDMGFAPQVKRIARYLPRERQTMLFSATMPESILDIAKEYMQLPIRIEIARAGTTAEKVTQELFIVPQEMKRTLLAKLLEEWKGSVLIFARTKANAKKITRALREMRHTAAEIHANRSLNQRREALEGFKTGRYRILVATDIASRGIDVKGIELVINYDLPDDVDNYVHRIGRTGRAGRAGHAITLASPDQGSQVRDIERLTREPLKVSTHPAVPEQRFSAGSSPQHRRPGPGGYGRGQGRPQRGHFRPRGRY
ncbi:MAG: ATP-dependent RNA helicase RhlE [Candidatus Omnitrophica bacterium]|nr:ATP-dependent RNA helicase RhlE [Candidatus Omnitrophota bacterium]